MFRVFASHTAIIIYGAGLVFLSVSFLLFSILHLSGAFPDAETPDGFYEIATAVIAVLFTAGIGTITAAMVRYTTNINKSNEFLSEFQRNGDFRDSIAILAEFQKGIADKGLTADQVEQIYLTRHSNPEYENLFKAINDFGHGFELMAIFIYTNATVEAPLRLFFRGMLTRQWQTARIFLPYLRNYYVEEFSGVPQLKPRPQKRNDVFEMTDWLYKRWGGSMKTRKLNRTK